MLPRYAGIQAAYEVRGETAIAPPPQQYGQLPLGFAGGARPVTVSPESAQNRLT